MRSQPRTVAAVAVVIALGVIMSSASGAAAERLPSPALLPVRMASTGGGTQLITAVADANGGRDGTLTWWQRDGLQWRRIGSAPARFGATGVSMNRIEGDGSTPGGLFSLTQAFGRRPNPGTAMPYRSVTAGSWWVGNPASARYNQWWQGCPASVCHVSGAAASEHLADYPQYDYAVAIDFNLAQVRPPSRPSGSAIFIHLHGAGHTAGCVSVDRDALLAVLRWLDPARRPHIAIGTPTTILRF